MAVKPLNSVAGFSVGEAPSTTIILANGDITTTNLTTTGVSDLGSISNVKITGGTSGQLISTDGTGNLSFTTISPGTLSNGTSNISILNNGNILFSVAGNANVATITGTGVNVAGYLNVTGNANAGNFAAAQIFATANVTSPQLISNATTGTAPLVVSSTTLVSNLNADLLDGYNTSTANTASTVVVRDANGNVSANFFIGDGSQLTGIDTSKISNGNSNVSIPAANGNVNITAVGNTTVVVTGTGANITGYANVTGNVTAGNVYANSGTIGAQTLKGEGGNISNIQGANVSGTVSSATTAGTVTTAAQPNITSTGVLNSLVVANTVYADGYAARTGSDLTISTAGNGNLNFSIAGTGVVNFGNTNIINAGNVSAGNISANIANLTTANVTGNVIAGGVKTDNLYYANGTPWDLQQPAGSNNEIQYNDNGSFGASANFTFNPTTNLFTVNGNAQFNNANLGNAATANYFIGSGNNLSNIQGANVSGTVASATSASTAGTVTANAQPNITSVGTLTSVAVTGNVTAGNVYANSGTIGALTLKGEGGNISNIQGANVSGTVSSATTAGTVTTAAQPNITSVGTLTSVDVTGNGTFGNVYANSGTIGAATLKGEGGNISNIQGANVSGTVASATNASAVLNNVASTGTFYPTFISSTSNGNYSLTSNTAYTANIANGFLGATLLGGTLTTAAQPNITSVGTLSSLAVTGTVTAGNVYANSGTIGANTLTAAANVNAGNANITANLTANFITSSNGLQVSNGPLTVSAGNLDVTGNINVTGNLNYSNVTDLVVGDPLIYIGANNTGDLYDLGIVASYNNGTYYHTGIARNHTTDYWTFFDGVVAEPTTVIDWANATYPTVQLGNLIATANANIGGYANVVGNISAGNVNAGNLLTANFVAGTLTTAAQPNITSVGTLSSLSVTANVTAGNVYANSGIIGAQTLKGEGGNISNIQGANVSGTVSSATTAGTVTTAAQPNITSVGTLTGLNVNGNIVAANITANTGVFTGNGSGLSAIAGANVTGQVGNALVAGTVYTAAQPNITSVGTLTSLSVTGNVSAGNISATNGNLTTANVSGNVILGNTSVTTTITWASVTTAAVTANQTIASFSVTGITGVEFLVKGVDATGSKYSVATVQAVTDGANVDYSTFGGVNLGGYTGTLAVNIVGGQIRLQVTPASSNSTVWTTQYRLI